MPEKDKLSLKDALNIAAQLSPHFESPTNQDELIEKLFETALLIQARYSDLITHHPSHQAVLNFPKSAKTEEQSKQQLSQLDGLRKSLS